MFKNMTAAACGLLVCVGVLGTAGCTAQPAPARQACSAVGFEDLAADDPGCGRLVMNDSSSEPVRVIEVNGASVSYRMIDHEPYWMAPYRDEEVADSYEYAYVPVGSAVERFERVDLVRLALSEDCDVRLMIEDPDHDHGCAYAEPERTYVYGSQITITAARASQITGGAVDGLIEAAARSGRDAVFQVDFYSKDAPSPWEWVSVPSGSSVWQEVARVVREQFPLADADQETLAYVSRMREGGLSGDFYRSDIPVSAENLDVVQPGFRFALYINRAI